MSEDELDLVDTQELINAMKRRAAHFTIIIDRPMKNSTAENRCIFISSMLAASLHLIALDEQVRMTVRRELTEFRPPQEPK